MARSATTSFSIDVEGLEETLKAFQTLERDFERPAANAKLRDAAGKCATDAKAELVRSASSSGVPVAPRVARSIRVVRDRMPALSIGGPMPVGATGGRASDLLWGSEHGPSGEVNHFAVPPGPGYWIKPAIDRFAKGPAVTLFEAAVADILHASGLD